MGNDLSFKLADDLKEQTVNIYIYNQKCTRYRTSLPEGVSYDELGRWLQDIDPDDLFARCARTAYSYEVMRAIQVTSSGVKEIKDNYIGVDNRYRIIGEFGEPRTLTSKDSIGRNRNIYYLSPGKYTIIKDTIYYR